METFIVQANQKPKAATELGSASEKTLASTYATKIVISGTDIYIGKANPGSSTSSSIWQIKKVATASDIIITWADGDALFDNVFDNYASLSYS